jgi:hypothetical protein
MLPDRIYWLLTAYVDGELNVSQRQRVERLMHQSAEARDLLGRLQQDAEALRRLPRLQLAVDFAGQVLQALPAQPLQPFLSAPTPAPLPAWVGWVAAAAVLFLVGTGSYLYFAERQWHEQPMSSLAVRLPGGSSRPDAEKEPDPELLAVLPAEKKPEPPALVGPRPEEAPRADAVAQGPNPERASAAPPPAPEPAANEARTKSLLTAPSTKLEKIKEVTVPGLAVFVPLRELDQEKSRRRLQEELQKENGYRLELACLETAKAFARVQTAFKAEGIRLVIDPDAQDRLSLPLKTNYLLYTEHVTAEELVRILQQVGADDQKAEAKRRGEGQFDKLALSRLTAATQKELTQFLGPDSTPRLPPRPRTPLEVDIRKPLTTATADQVEQALKGQGIPRPGAGPAVGPPVERLALVLTYDLTRLRPVVVTQEVHHFLQSRREPRAGTLQLFLVLRSNGG